VNSDLLLNALISFLTGAIVSYTLTRRFRNSA
jgi:hypothetical protein